MPYMYLHLTATQGVHWYRPQVGEPRDTVVSQGMLSGYPRLL